jgi:hypothetical protein
VSLSAIVLDYLKVFVSWPVLIFVLLILFKRDVSKIAERLAERLTSGKFGGIEVAFGSSVEEESKITGVLEAIAEEHPDVLKHSLEKAGATEDTYKEYQENVRSRIRKVQRFLSHLGYKVGPIDGILGPQTTASIRQFQTDNGLFPDGTVGPQTLQKMAEIQGGGRQYSL